MKLHDPQTEREVLRLAAVARGEKPIEPSDRRNRAEKLKGIAGFIFLNGAVAGMLGVTPLADRPAHWQYLICSIVLMVLSYTGISSLAGSITGSGYHAALANLPITGERALRFFRNRFLIRRGWMVLLVSFVCALALCGISQPWTLAVTSVLLFATTFATTMLLDEPWLHRLWIVKIWNILAILAVIAMGGCYFFTLYGFFGVESSPKWLADGIVNVTWIYSPSWCFPGRLEHGGFLPAVFWIGLGVERWMHWPKKAAPYFDAPQDFIGTFGDFGCDEDDGEIPATEETELPAAAQNAEPLTMSPAGWVDRLVARAVGENDKHLAGALANLNGNWTAQTQWVIRLAPAWLALIWAFSAFFPEGSTKNQITAWLWIASLVPVVAALVPVGSAIPRAMATGFPGPRHSAFFSMLPISVRDLLRISTRITVTRCLIAALIATPFFALQLAILMPEVNPWIAFWLVPAICFFWAASRPLFITYRIQTANRRRRGALLPGLIEFSLGVVLVVGWLISGAAGVISGFGYLAGTADDDDRWLLPVLALGGLLVSALCARAVFEIRRWLLSRRTFDWESPD